MGKRVDQGPLLDEEGPLLDEGSPLLDEGSPSVYEQSRSLDEESRALDEEPEDRQCMRKVCLASAGSDRFDFRVSTIWPYKSRGRGFNPALHLFHV